VTSESDEKDRASINANIRLPRCDVDYRPRRAAYAVIRDSQNRVAAVRGRSGYFLPGGGSRPDETPEQTLRREVREELASEIEILQPIGRAVQYFFADDCHYRMEADFFAAQFIGEPIGTGEHELCWVTETELNGRFYHKCHIWAIRQV
jgi:8-oxo-dGTP pyrophosphatase MutT (NUDIX family)